MWPAIVKMKLKLDGFSNDNGSGCILNLSIVIDSWIDHLNFLCDMTSCKRTFKFYVLFSLSFMWFLCCHKVNDFQT